MKKKKKKVFTKHYKKCYLMLNLKKEKKNGIRVQKPSRKKKANNLKKTGMRYHKTKKANKNKNKRKLE